MGLTLARTHQIMGLFGEEYVARGDKIRLTPLQIMLQNTHNGQDRYARRWFQIANGCPRVQAPNSGTDPEEYGPAAKESDHTQFVLHFRTLIRPSAGRPYLKLWFVYTGGTIRYRYRQVGGAFGSYTTSSTANPFAVSGLWTTWNPSTITLTPGLAYELDVELEAYGANAGEECYLLDAAGAEYDISSGDLPQS